MQSIKVFTTLFEGMIAVVFGPDGASFVLSACVRPGCLELGERTCDFIN